MHPVEVAFKRIKMPGPVFPERRQPGVDLEQGLGPEPVHPALGIDGGFDEAGVLEDAKMLGHSRLGHPEPLFELTDGLLGGKQEGQDGPAIGLGEDGKGRLHGLICLMRYIRVKG